MTISTLSNLPILKEVHSSNLLATLIRYMLERPEPSPTMYPLESIDFVSSQKKIFRAHAMSIQSSRRNIFFTTAKDLAGIGTPEETR